MRVATACLALAAIALASPTPSIAVPTAPPPLPQVAKPTPAEARAFLALYSPLEIRRSAELRILHRDFVPGLRKDPVLATMLDSYPTLGPELIKAMEGQMDTYLEEFQERFEPRASAIIAETMTRADLMVVHEFYASPLGRKVVREGAANIDGSAVVEKGLRNEKVDTADGTRQMIQSGIRVYAGLSPAEREELNRLGTSAPGRSLVAARMKIMALEAEIMNNPGPRFSAGAQSAIQSTMARVTGIDPRTSQ